MKPEMPQGIELVSCSVLDESCKSLAADADAALYKIWIPTERDEQTLKAQMKDYLKQDTQAFASLRSWTCRATKSKLSEKNYIL